MLNNQLSYITFKTCFEISAVTPFGNYPGQLTLLFLRKNHFFGHTALLSRCPDHVYIGQNIQVSSVVGHPVVQLLLLQL